MLAIKQSLTAEQRLHRAVVLVMRHPDYVPMQGILSIGSRAVDDKTPTACTNGRDEWYGRGFIEAHTDPELRFTVLHENYHKALKHLATYDKLFRINGQLANMSCDYVINAKLIQEEKERAKGKADYKPFVVMPSGGLYEPRFLDMSAGEVFKILQKEQEDGKDMSDAGSMDEHDWDGAKELTPEEAKELTAEVNEAIRQGTMLAGKLGGGLDKMFTDSAIPQVNWRDVLRDFLQTTCSGNDMSTWRRPRRKTMAHVYMPSGISEQVGELVEGADMSASMDRVMPIIRAETAMLLNTVKPEQLRVLYWDTKVCGDEVYDSNNMDTYESSTKPKGGGGTSPSCVPSYMTDNGIHPQAAIMITDGYVGGDWGTWTCPVLWIIIDNRRANPPCGKVVHIDSNKL